MGGRNIITGMLLVILLGACACKTPQVPTRPEVTTAEAYRSEISAMVYDIINPANSPDIKVDASDVIWQVGTVVSTKKDQAFPFAADCVPDAKELSTAVLTKVPTYSTSSERSAKLGVTNKLINELTQAGAGFELKNTDNIVLGITDAKLVIIPELNFQALLKKDACKRALAAGDSLLIVRGTVTGKRNFKVSNENGLSFNANLAIADFKITPGSQNKSVTITDDKPTDIISIISAVKVENGVPVVSKPVAASGHGRVYIHRDSTDGIATSQAVLRTLRQSQFDVVPEIESIAHAQMPRSPQIRYFRADDRAQAEKAASAIRATVPRISTVLIELPVPSGQMEVWLPKP